MSGIFRHIVLWVLASAFSWATAIMAAGPLRALRLSSPFWVFWPVGAVIASGIWVGGFPVAACVFAAMILVVGIYTEIENWGAGRGVAALGSMVGLVAAVGTGFGFWCRTLRVSPQTWLAKWVEPMVLKMKELYPALEVDADLIVSQIPSALVITGLIGLALAVATQKTWLRFLGASEVELEGARNRAWTDFKVWDVAIYVLMLALLASLTRHGVKPVSMVGSNILNVMIVLYFFQGMAVVFSAFDVFRVGPLWRLIVGFVLVFQLAILVAIVGVADYWIEFRERLTRPVGPPGQRS